MASHPLSAPPPSQPEAPIPSAPPTILKFVLIGDAATGKTAFRERFIRDRFTGIYRATIGCDFLGRVVQVDRVPGYDIDAEDGNETEAEPRGPDEARLQVWDTAGQERFRSLAPAFYRSSDACLLLYSLASSLSPTKTAESITTWFHEFSTKCPVDDPRLFSWACVGTKADEVRGDPEREKRAREIQDEVERALRKLMPRRVVEVGGSNGDKQKRRRAARVGNGVEQARPPPTVSVEVLPPKGSKEAAARRRQKLAAARATSSTTSIAQDELPKVVVDGEQVAPSALDPHSSNRDPNLLIDRPSTSRTSTANSTTSSNAASVATATTTGTAATFELDAPLSDLLYATSPPPAPAHFGPAGAPPAVYIGGPYRDPEGRLLGSEDVDAVLEEGGGAPDHRREGLEQAEDQNQDLDELERDAEEIGEGQAEGEEGCKLEEEEERYEDQGIRHFRWTSAKTGEGVQEVFEYLTRRVLTIRRAEALSEDEHAAHDVAAQPTDELLERIFTEYYLEERQAHVQQPRNPILIICKRVSTLVERLWLQTIRFHASRKKTESFLANLINSQPNKRAAVRDLEIYVHPDSTVLVYAALADLPSLHSLCLRLVDDNLQDFKGAPMGSADSRNGLQPLDAGSFDVSTADNLQQAGITNFELHFHREGDATDLADLPWSLFRRLVLVFHYDDLEEISSCIRSLAQQSLDGSKATNLQALEIKLLDGGDGSGETILDHLRCAFQQCSLTHLALFSNATGPVLQLDEDWSALRHLSFHVHQYDLLSHRFEDFASVLGHCDNLLSLTLRAFDYSSCECCYMDVDIFIGLDEKDWLPEGRNLIAVVYLVRHQTEILDLRIQSDDGCHELRWTRTDGADDFALGRWTLF
ncbi:hypothetical protein B0A53_02941 [Rhodotorula sp. CCFEE 5036]|nr:hypothetical protein B0A53_02941 [Rhodotorula sp. CCFEE 5036]